MAIQEAPKRAEQLTVSERQIIAQRRLSNAMVFGLFDSKGFVVKSVGQALIDAGIYPKKDGSYNKPPINEAGKDAPTIACEIAEYAANTVGMAVVDDFTRTLTDIARTNALAFPKGILTEVNNSLLAKYDIEDGHIISDGEKCEKVLSLVKRYSAYMAKEVRRFSNSSFGFPSNLEFLTAPYFYKLLEEYLKVKAVSSQLGVNSQVQSAAAQHITAGDKYETVPAVGYGDKPVDMSGVLTQRSSGERAAIPTYKLKLNQLIKYDKGDLSYQHIVYSSEQNINAAEEKPSSDLKPVNSSIVQRQYHKGTEEYADVCEDTSVCEDNLMAVFDGTTLVPTTTLEAFNEAAYSNKSWKDVNFNTQMRPNDTIWGVINAKKILHNNYKKFIKDNNKPSQDQILNFLKDQNESICNFLYEKNSTPFNAGQNAKRFDFTYSTAILTPNSVHALSYGNCIPILIDRYGTLLPLSNPKMYHYEENGKDHTHTPGNQTMKVKFNKNYNIQRNTSDGFFKDIIYPQLVSVENLKPPFTVIMATDGIPEFDEKSDFWNNIREQIITVHQSGKKPTQESLNAILNNAVDKYYGLEVKATDDVTITASCVM